MSKHFNDDYPSSGRSERCLLMENARLRAELAKCQARLLEASRSNERDSWAAGEYYRQEEIERGKQGIFG